MFINKPNIKMMISDGKCISLPVTYKKINSAKMRKNLIFNFDFASMSKSRSEKSNDNTTERTILKKKVPTLKREITWSVTRKLNNRMPRMSENEAS